jgi:L-rhamnose mutarotase
VKRWWAHMADVMETDENNVPTQVPLREMFYLA